MTFLYFLTEDDIRSAAAVFRHYADFDRLRILCNPIPDFDSR